MKYDFDLEDHSKEKRNISSCFTVCFRNRRSIICGICNYPFWPGKNDGIREIYESYLERWG